MLHKRCQILLALAGQSQTEFAQTLDVHPSTVSKLLSGGQRRISRKLAQRISAQYGCDYDWVLSGAGDPPTEVTVVDRPLGESRETPIVEVQILTCQAVTSYPWDGEPETIGTTSLPREIVTVDNKTIAHAVKYGGHSMRPTILNGSLVGIDLENRHAVDNALFAVQLSSGGYPVVRRLKPQIGGYMFSADNPATEDQPVAREHMESGEVRILGRVRWIFSSV